MTPSLGAFIVILVFVALERLAEVAVSLRRLRGRPAARVTEPALLPFMVLLHVALVVAPVVEVVVQDRPFSPLLASLAAVALVLATALRVWAMRALGRAWNVAVIVPSVVVSTGPFAWVRHPNYLVVVLEVACLPLLHGAWLSCITLSVWNALVLARRIRTEEAALETVPAWRAAMRGKARLVPGVL